VPVTSQEHGARLPTVPRTVWVLGLVSLSMDISSEMIHALMPLFLTVTLGASASLIGMIEGIAESSASIVKVFSGYLSDRLGRRKPLLLAGYGLGALSKPLFALAGAPSVVFIARLADRIGKGIRGAPRDALVADVTPPSVRGRAYGLRQSLDTIGAFVGPLMAIGLMVLFADNARAVFWVAVIPAVVSVLIIVWGVKERPAGPERARPAPVRLADLRGLDRAFWVVTMVGVVFTLARFSEAFLILKSYHEGLPLALAPVVLVVMNLVYSLGAYPAGARSDRASPSTLLLWGFVLLVAADLALAWASGLTGVLVGVALWGLHMALTQGLFAKLVAQHAPEQLRGSAFGMFNLATGVVLMIASVVAGLLWDSFGPSATFIAGAGFAALAGTLFVAFKPGWR